MSTMTPARPPQAQARRAMVRAVVIDVAVPLAVYYALRAAGASQWLALLAGAAAPAAQAGYTLARKRSVDWFAMTVLVIILASVAASFIGGSPRFLLARDGCLTGLIGLGVLVTLGTRRPVMFTVGRAMVRTVGESTDAWDERWDRSAPFRRVWRVVTAVWGVGLLLDASARVLMAYALPVDVVPALSTATWIVVLIVLQVISQLLLRRPHVKPLVFE